MITGYPDNHCLITRYPDNRYETRLTQPKRAAHPFDETRNLSLISRSPDLAEALSAAEGEVEGVVDGLVFRISCYQITPYATKTYNQSSVVGTSTSVENPLQIDLFMQNKPKVKYAQINVISFITSKYVKVDNW